MSTSKKGLKNCEPPLKKHLDLGKVTESSKHLDLGEDSKVIISREHLDAISSLWNKGDFVEDEKESPRSKRCDFVEPPLKKSKFRFDESENSKVTVSSETLVVGENSKVTVSSEHLDVGENSKVTVLSEHLDVGENSKVNESSEHLDVMSFLSNNGKTNYLVRSNGEFVSLNVVRGKHLIICAVSLPSPSPQDSVPFWRFVTEAYPELSQSGFELIVSVTVKRNKKEKLRFDNFLSTLPCLAIPYPDLDTRNSVCSFINTKCAADVNTSIIVVDPAGLILPYRGIHMQILRFGFEWLTRKVKDIVAEDNVLKIRLDLIYKKRWERGSVVLPDSINRDVLDQPLSLHQDFLLCDPSCVLSTFDNHLSLPVSELSKKHVALYLCLRGNFMGQLNEVYKQCLENNQELEVVLVCMPYFEEPKLYYDKVTELLKRYDIKSWFVFPFDNKVCFRLWRAFCDLWDVEKLIILPPNCKSSGDMKGRAVIQKMGINAYPFTRSAVLEQRFNFLKSLNPDSFFQASSKKRTCLFRNGESPNNVPHSAIKGKKLILYLDRVDLSLDGGQLCRLLMKLYPKFQSKGCEVVFVPLDKEVGRPHHVDLAKMPWPMMPDEAAIKAAVPGNFKFRDEGYFGNQLIVFGKDGKILSRWIKKKLMVYGITKRIFHDYIREEIIASLELIEE